MRRPWTNRLTDSISARLEANQLTQHLNRVWIFKNRSLVFDFSYKKVNFGFDLTPNRDGNLHVALIQRGKLGGAFSVVSEGQRKQVLATASSEAESVELILAALEQAQSRIDAFRDGGERPKPTEIRRRVGVLTLPLSKNYGGNLQAFALMQVLRDLGCDPILINRRYAVEAPKRKDTADISAPISNKIEIRTPCENISFIEKHILPISRPFYTSQQLRKHARDYGLAAVVAGSDQVWRPKYARGLLPDFFHNYLDPEDRSIRRISYAASFGSDTWDYDERQTQEAAKRVQLFDAVSVREDGAVDMCGEHLGVKAQHVLDPTMLLEPRQYAKIISERIDSASQRRLTTYILDQNADKMDLVAKVADRLGLLPAPTFKPNPTDGKAALDQSVEAWLAAFWHADFVFTDSFHGVAFSILFNKPFIAFGNPMRGIARFTSILRTFGLEDRLVLDAASTDVERLLQPIDWASVNDRMEAFRELSKAYLRDALALPQENHPDQNTSQDGRPQQAAPAKARLSAKAFGAGTSPLGQLCTGCGVCVSESNGGLEMAWDEDGFWKPRLTGAANTASASRVCPFNPEPAPKVRDEDAIGRIVHATAPQHHLRGGRFENTYIGYSNAYRPGASSGGVATYVFDQLLRRKDIARLFVVQGDAEGGYSYRAFEAGQDINAISKTRYFPVTLERLFEMIEQTDGRVGVSGVACFIKALRLKQHYNPEFKERIGFLVGIICGGLKSRFYTDFLAGSAGIAGTYKHAQYRVKNPEGEASDYSFSAEDDQGETRQVRMRRLGDMWGSGLFKNKACDFCTDVLTELADISLGDAWIPEYNRDGMGNSVVVTRSKLADQIIRDGIEAGELTMIEAPMDLIVRSQSGGVNHKLNALKFRRWFSANFTALPIPACRTRLEKEVGAAEMLVQVLRERVRSNSLRFWRESTDLRSFNRRMRASRDRLGATTAARKKQPREVYDMLVAGLVPDQARRKTNTEIDAIRPLVRWVRRKIATGELDLATLLPLLPEEQQISPASLAPIET